MPNDAKRGQPLRGWVFPWPHESVGFTHGYPRSGPSGADFPCSSGADVPWPYDPWVSPTATHGLAPLGADFPCSSGADVPWPYHPWASPTAPTVWPLPGPIFRGPTIRGFHPRLPLIKMGWGEEAHRLTILFDTGYHPSLFLSRHTCGASNHPGLACLEAGKWHE